MNKVVIGMSGGVDSSASAAILLEMGYDVIGVTMKLWDGVLPDGKCCSLSAADDAKKVADKLGIPFYVLDFTNDFNKYVIDNFTSEYLMGRTPNPCVMCNKYLKFDAMLQGAKKLGADYIATGHYAKIEEKNGRFLLKRCADTKKDQTYFLYTLTQEQLSHTIFPLYGVTKDETRDIAERLGLEVAKKRDSQEICFIPDGDYASFIAAKGGISQKGEFVTTDGKVVGEHSGIINYTIGQRKGLGIALNKPVYVTDIDVENNRVVLGDNDELFGTTLFAKDVNFIPFDELKGEMKCTAKVRYRTVDSPCTVTPVNGGVKVVFEQPQRAITKGQAVVFYDGDTVLGGGIIDA